MTSACVLVWGHFDHDTQAYSCLNVLNLKMLN